MSEQPDEDSRHPKVHCICAALKVSRVGSSWAGSSFVVASTLRQGPSGTSPMSLDVTGMPVWEQSGEEGEGGEYFARCGTLKNAKATVSL